MPSTAGVEVPPSARAMPKSSTFTPPPDSMMLAGLMSRCTSPAACAASSASHTAAAIAAASPAGSIPASSRTWRRVRPATSSITINGVVPSTPLSNTVTSRGWHRKPASAANCGLSTLTATSRPRIPSLARHTVAIPPVPSTSPSAYRPPSTRVPVTTIAHSRHGLLADLILNLLFMYSTRRTGRSVPGRGGAPGPDRSARWAGLVWRRQARRAPGNSGAWT